MKKITFALFMLVLFMNPLFAKLVTETKALQVAQHFYNQNTTAKAFTATLVNTETDASGIAVYYVFNMNTKEGFVIISAEDAINPVIGYSLNNGFVKPGANTTIASWLNLFKKEISTLRKRNSVATDDIKKEWEGYFINSLN